MGLRMMLIETFRLGVGRSKGCSIGRVLNDETRSVEMGLVY